MENKQEDIPESWAHTSLEHVCQILDSMRIPVNNSERSKRIEGKSDDELYPYYGATGQVGVIDDYIFDGEHILLGEDGAPFLDPVKDKAYLASGKYWVNNHAHILKALTSNKFLFHFLNQVDYSEHVTGTTRLKLTQAALRQIPIRFAPENEQQRIVAKIEELFSELDKGVESLNTAREQLKVYRQAILKHAFEGKLTAQWREENTDKLETPRQLLARIKKERETHYHQQFALWQNQIKDWQARGQQGPKPPKPTRHKDSRPIGPSELTSLPHLPNDWGYARLAEVAQIGSGMSVSKSRALVDPIEVKYLRVANVQRGRLNLDQITTMFIERSQLPRLELKHWDVLFTEGGDRDKLGRGWVWESQVERCITQNHVFRASPYVPSNAHAKFISHWGNTFGQIYFDTFGKQTTNLASINKKILSHFPVPLATFEEQAQILDKLDNLLTTLDQIEVEIATALIRIGALRQSVLKKAFAGQLVAQDPNDEAASVLLERIRAEKKGQAEGRTKYSNRDAA